MIVSRRSRPRRSATEWLVRLLLLVVVLLAGYVGVTFSLARVLFRSNPETAHLLAPYDGRITAALAFSLASKDAKAVDFNRADTLARLALRQTPTSVVALSTLGLIRDARGDVRSARLLFNGAETLSRRDLPTQLWMIEDTAVRRGDVAAALRHYDIALRVFPNSWELLFPVLATASGSPVIRSGLIRTLSAPSAWGPFFVEYIAGHGPDPHAAAQLLLTLRRKGGNIPDKAQASVIDRLVDDGSIDEAWTYYASLRPGMDRRRSRDAQFAYGGQPLSQFDWQPVESAGVTASIQNGVFDFMVATGAGGPILRQAQLLPQGVYRLDGHSVGIDQSGDARPYWVLSCRDGRELGRIVIPDSSKAQGRFSGTLTVPPSCPMQSLALIAQPSDGLGGLAGQIDRAQVVPASRAGGSPQ
ncbi:MAG: hypothetical protein PGN08_04680 [Sphingomonas taxi]